MSKYIDLYNKLNKNNTTESVLSALAVINTRLLVMDKDSILNDEKAILDFFNFFTDKCMKNEELSNAIKNNYVEEKPLIVDIALQIQAKKRLEVMKKNYDKLNKEKKEQVDKLINYIIEKQKDIEVSISNTNNLHLTLSIYKNIQEEPEEYNNVKDYLKGCFSTSLLNEEEKCGIVLRVHRENKKDVIYGFHIEDGEINVITAIELKYCMELQPDGTMINFDDKQVYKTARIEF